jgi:hypothetical protein
MAEDKYQRNAKEVSGFLRDPHVEGVYEVASCYQQQQLIYTYSFFCT